MDIFKQFKHMVFVNKTGDTGYINKTGTTIKIKPDFLTTDIYETFDDANNSLKCKIEKFVNEHTNNQPEKYILFIRRQPEIVEKLQFDTNKYLYRGEARIAIERCD